MKIQDQALETPFEYPRPRLDSSGMSSKSWRQRLDQPSSLKTQRNPSLTTASGKWRRRAHEADECDQNISHEQVCLSGGDIYDDPSLLKFYQNNDIPPWGNYLKEGGEEDLHWVLRRRLPLATQLWPSQLDLGPLRDLPYPASHTSPLPHEQASNDEIGSKEPQSILVLKDLLSHKEKLEKAASSVKLSEECSAVIQKGLPQKEGDPGSFTLPCLIGPLAVKNALADLGASINLMPYFLFHKFGISELKPTKMSIQLADRSLKYPIGVCENLLVKINKFIFLVDFVVLEMDEDESVPIILGRPFLATARAVIDVHDGRMSLRVGKETVTFNIVKSIRGKQPHSEYLYCANQTVKFVHDQWMDTVHLDGKWVETDQNHEKAQAVTFHLRHEVEPLKWRAPKNRLKPSIKESPKLELMELPENLEYAFLQGDDQLHVVISSSLSKDEKSKLFNVLRNHKGSITWSIADIKGIDSSFCTYKILIEDESKPTVQPQRRVNPNIKEVVKKEVIKLLDVGLIYPISDSPWMLERLAGHEYYCFLDGFSGYFQIPIALEDQEKTTFTYPYGTFAYKRMPCGQCNAPATFQRYMMAIFYQLIEDSMEVFMDDISVFGNSFDHCLVNLGKMLKRCEETNLVLNWEKRHFMVIEGIVLGHKVSGAGIEVDKAKIDSIAKLPQPTTIKAIRSFLGHAFKKLKHELTQASVMIKSDWSLPFEIMCDTSDYVVGAVLGQRINNNFQLIHYASKTMNAAQENYTTTKNELLAVVFAFNKFRQYLVLSKMIVFIDHSALRYLFSKQDAKSKLIRWILLLQEFDIEIRDKKGAKN
ncbi:putative nucleotidyltransferase, ribonuclease H [Tanacetum coccineum]